MGKSLIIIKKDGKKGALVMMIENEKNEFKSEYNEKILKTAIAFANTEGGVIYVGVDDNGKAVGLTDIDITYNKITNFVRDSIAPDITMFIKYELSKNENTIKLIISEGTRKPYFLKAKGMRPEGVFVRQGASTVPASFEQIRQMIKISEDDSFERRRSLEQNLHFSEAVQEFNLKKVEFNEDKYVNLGVKSSSDGLYTNLALVLSDECEHTIKIAVFEGNSKQFFKDRKEFTGSIFKQLRNCYEYLELCNHVEATFSGLDRIDKEDYPKAALREALLNALVHRDYGFSGSVMVNVFDDRIEFVSLGGLVSGLSKEDILRGVSQTRNKNLANIFYRLKHIEAYGTGIQRIFDLYEDSGKQPEIIITENTFTMVLPNCNFNKSDSLKDMNVSFFTSQENEIIDYIKKHGSITDDEIQVLLNVKKTRAYIIIKALKEKGAVVVGGKGRNKKYHIV